MTLPGIFSVLIVIVLIPDTKERDNINRSSKIGFIILAGVFSVLILIVMITDTKERDTRLIDTSSKTGFIVIKKI